MTQQDWMNKLIQAKLKKLDAIEQMEQADKDILESNAALVALMNHDPADGTTKVETGTSDASHP